MSKSILGRLGKAYAAFQDIRAQAYRVSQDVLRLSKHAIFALHHGGDAESAALLKKADAAFTQLKRLWKRDSRIRFEGSTRAALEEYVESRTYWSVVKSGKIVDIPDAFDEEYIAGLADLTGELVRRAVMVATEGGQPEFDRLYRSVREIVGALHTFPLTGYVRQKADDAKRNLHKIEDLRLHLNARHQ